MEGGIDNYDALYTTRAMPRLKPDPIPDAVQARILDAAIRAPNPEQGWHVVLVDDPAIKLQFGPLYRQACERMVGAPWRVPRRSAHDRYADAPGRALGHASGAAFCRRPALADRLGQSLVGLCPGSIPPTFSALVVQRYENTACDTRRGGSAWAVRRHATEYRDWNRFLGKDHLMVNQLLPKRIDNTYRGYTPALWIFGLLMFMRGAMSSELHP